MAGLATEEHMGILVVGDSTRKVGAREAPSGGASRVDSSLDPAAESLRALREEVFDLHQALVRKDQELRELRNTLSFRLGEILLKTGSPRGILSLPLHLWTLRREAMRRRRTNGEKSRERMDADGMPWSDIVSSILQIYFKDGMASAVRLATHLLGETGERAELYASLARALVTSHPQDSACLARLAWEQDPTPERTRWLAFLLFDLGHLQEPSALLESLTSCEAMRSTDHRKAEQIRGLNAALRGTMAIPDAGVPSWAFERRALYVAAASLPFHISGYTIRTQALVSAVRKTGWDLRCLTRPGYPMDRTDALQPVRESCFQIGEVAYRIARGGSTRAQGLDRYTEVAALIIEREIVRFRPSVVHAASNHVNALPALLAARRLGVPFVYEVRGFWELTDASLKSGWERTERFAIARHLESLVAREANHVFTLTAGMRRELIDRGVPAERISLLPNGADIDRLPSNEETCLQKKSLGISERDPVILYAGSVNNFEGIDDLVRAFSQNASAVSSNSRLVIVGDGNAMESVRRLSIELDLGDRMICVGHVEPQLARTYLSIADIVVVPRKPCRVCELVSPMKPLEAMACGKAVVVSNVEALLEMVVDGVTGLVCRAGDVASLSACLSRLLDNAALRSHLGANARQQVAAERSWSRTAKTVADVYSALCDVE